MNTFLLIIVALFLVLLNGFFVAAEFSLVRLRQTRVRSIAQLTGLRGRLLSQVHGQLDAYLSACQLGITLASLGLGWVGEPAFATLLLPLFSLFSITSEHIIHGVAFVTAFCLISFLHIVVGELAPKSMAIYMAEKVALWTAPFLYGFYWMMYPAIKVLNLSAQLILKWVRVDITSGKESHYSADELKLILRSGEVGSKKNRDGWNTLLQVLDFGNLDVSDLMRPINEVVALYKNMPLEDNMATMLQNRFSRYPYFDEDDVTVLGILHVKDLFFSQQKGESLHLGEHLRQVEFVPPTMPAVELFRRFRKGAPHFALVGYPGSKPVGFLTLDNLLSALIGQIRDEFRENEHDWTPLDDGTFIGKGSLPLYTLGAVLGIDLDSDEVESIGGLVMHALGDLPIEGQRIPFPQFDVVVKKMNGPRITLVCIYPK